jgi:hypothetical protein
MSGSQRGYMLNPHGKQSRILSYSSLPVALSQNLFPSTNLMAKIVSTSKNIINTLSNNLYSYIFPSAQVNSLIRQRSFFEILDTNPISKLPAIQTEPKEIFECETELILKRPPSQETHNTIKKRKIPCHSAEAQTDLPYTEDPEDFKPKVTVPRTRLIKKNVDLHKKDSESVEEMDTKGTDEDEDDFGKSLAKRKVIKKVPRRNKLSIIKGPELRIISERGERFEIDEVIEKDKINYRNIQKDLNSFIGKDRVLGDNALVLGKPNYEKAFPGDKPGLNSNQFSGVIHSVPEGSNNSFKTPDKPQNTPESATDSKLTHNLFGNTKNSFLSSAVNDSSNKSFVNTNPNPETPIQKIKPLENLLISSEPSKEKLETQVLDKNQFDLTHDKPQTSSLFNFAFSSNTQSLFSPKTPENLPDPNLTPKEPQKPETKSESVPKAPSTPVLPFPVTVAKESLFGNGGASKFLENPDEKKPLNPSKPSESAFPVNTVIQNISSNPFLNTSIAKTIEIPYKFGDSVSQNPVSSVSQLTESNSSFKFIENTSSKGLPDTNASNSMMCDIDMASSTPQHDIPATLPIEKQPGSLNSTSAMGITTNFNGNMFSNSIQTPNTNNFSMFTNSNPASLFSTSNPAPQFGKNDVFSNSNLSSLFNTSNPAPQFGKNEGLINSNPVSLFNTSNPAQFGKNEGFGNGPSSLFGNNGSLPSLFTPGGTTQAFNPATANTGALFTTPATPATAASTPGSQSKGFSLGIVSGKKKK